MSSSSRSSSPTMSSPRTPPNLHQNSADPSATWIVQKYGGTSVGKFAACIAEDILPDYLDRHKVAIVCSARSGNTKASGTTNLLLRAADEALQRPSSPTMGGCATPLSPLQAAGGAKWGKSSGLAFHSSPPRSPNGASSPPATSRPNTPPPRSSLDRAQNGSSLPAFYATVDVIREEHIQAAKDLINDEAILSKLTEEIENDLDGLKTFLFAARVIGEISPRSKDSIVGIGERLACKLVAAVLRDRGIDAEFISLENLIQFDESTSFDITSTTLSGTITLSQTFYDRVSLTLGGLIQSSTVHNRIPVITGYFGPVPGSLLLQIGRGYTDLLAALLSVGLGATELQIYKEVDGIFTADPRKVPMARLLKSISPDEAAELTYYGSEVVHPFVMEQVMRKGIPIRIKNVSNHRGNGTLIVPTSRRAEFVDEEEEEGFWQQPPRSPTLSNGNPLSQLSILPNSSSSSSISSKFPSPALTPKPKPKTPTAVTIKENIVIVNVHSNRKSVSHGFLAGIFSLLDKYGVVVDLISTSEVHVSMAIEGTLALVNGGTNGMSNGWSPAGKGKLALAKFVEELQKSGTVTTRKNMTILSLVGSEMKSMVGIASRMFSSLAEGEVNIEMISQGASEINISCVIESRDAVKALNLIHQNCLQIRVEGSKGRVGPWLF